MSEDTNGGFKVNDKRLFDENGNERENVVSENKTEAKGQDFVMKDSQPKQSNEPPKEIDFSTFVMSLAMQAYMQLGEVQPPEGFNVAKDKMAAKQTIDILKLIEEKTKGNLTQDEDWMLKDVLQRLQLSFVKAS